jgi:cysteine desulfurase
MEGNMVYLDYAATTPFNKEVIKTHEQLLEKYFYNADSIYSQGIEVNRLLEKSRSLIAGMLHVKDEEIIFTSCGSEANNMAIKGIAFQYQNRGKHIITTSIEHSSVYEACKELEEIFGFDVTYLPVDHSGHISIDDLKKSIREDTILVSVMHINNEVGAIQPIEEIKKVIKEHPLIKFHVDMVQSFIRN